MSHECDSTDHPPEGQCVICYAFRNGSVCIDTQRKDYPVCEEHLKLSEGSDA